MRHRNLSHVAVLVICSMITLPGRSAAQKNDGVFAEPRMRLNDPFVAPLWRIAYDNRTQVLATGSAAKAVSLWRLGADKPGPTIARVPLRREERQRAHGVAITDKHVFYSVPPLRTGKGYAVFGTSRIYVSCPRKTVPLIFAMRRASDGPEASL
jgi:hypothetical protein